MMIDFLAVKASHPANNRRIVAESAVSVNLAPVGENALNIIQRVRTLRMTRQFGPLPRVQMRRNLAAKVVHAIVQLLDLPKRFRVLPLQRLQTRDLLFDFFQFLLRLQSRIHLDDVPILSRMMRFHDREHEVGAGDGGILAVCGHFLRRDSTSLPALFSLVSSTALNFYALPCRDQLMTRTLPRPHSSSTRPRKLRSGITL